MTEIRTRTTHVNGVDLELLESGPADGPVVILSHGFPESSWSWRHQLPVLGEAGWHAIAPPIKPCFEPPRSSGRWHGILASPKSWRS